jgi:hypothetical protein
MAVEDRYSPCPYKDNSLADELGMRRTREVYALAGGERATGLFYGYFKTF